MAILKKANLMMNVNILNTLTCFDVLQLYKSQTSTASLDFESNLTYSFNIVLKIHCVNLENAFNYINIKLRFNKKQAVINFSYPQITMKIIYEIIKAKIVA